MKKTALYLDCSHGISGDMSVAALLSLGASENHLISSLQSLNLNAFDLKISQINKQHKIVYDYSVLIKEEMLQPPIRRNIFDIYHIIDASALLISEKKMARKIFKIAADAGATAHKVPLKDFFFHESGAADSIADIIGIAICLNDIIAKYEISHIFISKLVDGSGTITLHNGKILPIPVPAVKVILETYQLPYQNSTVEGELVTPTGASFAAAIYSPHNNELPQNYHTIKSGFGNGKRTYESESILKIDLIEWTADP